ncbi:MAG: glycerol-3-phosphate 1-O-acyltransferase PlsY [Limisphaerales bacterium]
MLALVVVIAGAYLLGSIPTGYLVALLRGVDLRAHGSGNIGATNAFRVLGKGPGAFVLLADALKGSAAVLWMPALAVRIAGSTASESLPLIAGVAAILGHNYTCWLRFKGGKGIATTAGVMATLVPVGLLITFVSWLIVFLTTRYVSVASIVAAIVLPIATMVTSQNRALWAVALVFGVLAIWRHRGNLQRLRAGTETRIEFGRKTPTPKP